METKKLCEIAVIAAGQGAPQGEENYGEIGTPFIKAGNLVDLINGLPENEVQKVTESVAKKHRLKLYPAGTVLFAKSGMSCMKGYVYQLKQPCYVVSHLACVTPTDISGEYLRYYFEYHKPNKLVKDESYPSISLADIGNMSITYANDEQQRYIVNILNKVCKLIEVRRKELEKLDNLVKSQFIEMFGDVVQNNKNWEKLCFGDITESRLGKMLDAKKQKGLRQFPYLANYNVQWFRFNLQTLNVMDFDEKEQVEFSLKDGDLLVCEGGEIGRCAIWHNEIESCYFQKALHRVRCNYRYVLPIYLAWWFKYNCDNNGFADIEGAKATISHLPGAKLKKLFVAVPPIELQNEFARFVEQTDKSKVLFMGQKKLYNMLGKVEKNKRICYNSRQVEVV